MSSVQIERKQQDLRERMFAVGRAARAAAAELAQAKPAVKRAALEAAAKELRAAAKAVLRANAEDVDVIVPRGGKSLIARVQQDARVPVMAHLEGICHT